MQADNPAQDSELFIKLIKLEEKVASLTKETLIDKETIKKLQRIIANKTDTIAELEAALTNTEYTLKEVALGKINQFKDDISNGIDQKAVQPALQRLNQLIDRIQSIIVENRKLVNHYLAEINHTYQKTATLIAALPEKSKAYVQTSYANLVESQIKRLTTALKNVLHKITTMTEQKIINPVKTTIEKVVTLSRDKTAQLQFHVEDRLITSPKESISEFIEDILFVSKEYLKEIVYQLKKQLQHLTDSLLGIVTKTDWYQSFNKKLASLRHQEPPPAAFA